MLTAGQSLASIQDATGCSKATIAKIAKRLKVSLPCGDLYLANISRALYIASMQWTVETLNAAVDAEIEDLPPSLQARLIRLMEMVENVGLDQLREPHVKHVDGKIWELRAKASEGIARGLYVTLTGRRVVVLHVFVKKSQKTPPVALRVARERMKSVEP